MSSAPICKPSAGLAYPERSVAREPWLERVFRVGWGRWRRIVGYRSAALGHFAAAVECFDRDMRECDDSTLVARAKQRGEQMRVSGFDATAVAEVFAICREASRRTLGLHHFPVQLMGGWVLLTGKVAEMSTGEGKTLTATLPAITAALSGIPVHVVTVNDYLAARDAEGLEPLYRFFGLQVGLIREGLSAHERKIAYGADVTYCTNKELTFDYLKDRILLEKKGSRLRVQVERIYRPDNLASQALLRGLCFVILDEIDSVLVDEARTPLIISRDLGAGAEIEMYERAVAAARDLSGVDFRIDALSRNVELTSEGRARVEALTAGLGGVWSGPRRTEELVVRALSALHLFNRDEHYVVVDDKVQIVDEYTGRIFSDRAWEQGLHQMIEVKESVAVTAARTPLARISYQQFFQRFVRVAGMSGTVQEIAPELRQIYDLDVVRIPPNRALRRRRYPTMVLATEPEKWRVVASRAREMMAAKRPVLIGTRSVAASQALSQVLHREGIEHRVLNATQNAAEASIVAAAGRPGQVTVATNMAGRGTDIVLGPGVAEVGGLHVIATERHDSRRIDRQLYGRCARQGDPGSYQNVLSLDDELLRTFGRAGLTAVARLGFNVWAAAGAAVANLAYRLAQERAQTTHARQRRALLKADEQLEDTLAFTGRGE